MSPLCRLLLHNRFVWYKLFSDQMSELPGWAVDRHPTSTATHRQAHNTNVHGKCIRRGSKWKRETIHSSRTRSIHEFHPFGNGTIMRPSLSYLNSYLV